MKKKKIRVIAVLLAICLLAGSVAPVYGARNVTKTYKAQVGKMLRKLDSYLGYGCGDGKVFKYDIYARTTMAYFMNPVTPKSLSEAKRLSQADLKLYFGTTRVKLKKFDGRYSVKNPSYLLRNQNGKVVYIGGDWGDCYPKGRVKKIVKTGSKSYVVTYVIYMYDSYDKVYMRYMGTYKIYLKKASNQNGFIITNMKRTGTCHGKINW